MGEWWNLRKLGKAGTKRAENRELQFSAYKRYVDCGPDQTAGSGN